MTVNPRLALQGKKGKKNMLNPGFRSQPKFPDDYIILKNDVNLDVCTFPLYTQTGQRYHPQCLYPSYKQREDHVHS